MVRWTPLLLLLVGLVVGCSCAARGVRGVGRSVGAGVVEIRGVGAGEFREGDWREGRLNFVPDVREPLVGPLEGKYRNIYAPSVVAQPDGSFRLFYGGWDGVATGNDRIYSMGVGEDFLSFWDRRVVVEHGPFQHVCNVSAVRNGDGSFTLLCTAYPDEKGLNKPVSFWLPARMEGPPVVAGRGDVVAMEGYPGYLSGDLNGMNPVVLGEDGRTIHLYFANFRDFGRVYHATSGDGRRFACERVSLEFAGMPNDAKRFRTPGGIVTLLALHQNGGKLFYAMSRDGKRFDAPQVLAEHLSEADRYMVAVAMVTRGERVLGFLYGAGAVPSLDQNRIFARWLQRKVIFVTEDGRRLVATRALGPDRALVELEGPTRGRLEVYAEDGVTRLFALSDITLAPGTAYAVRR